MTDNNLFKSDFDEYTVKHWQEGIETFKARRKDKGEYLPYKYLASIVKGLADEEKQANAVKRPKVTYTIEEPLKLPSAQVDDKAVG